MIQRTDAFVPAAKLVTDDWNEFLILDIHVIPRTCQSDDGLVYLAGRCVPRTRRADERQVPRVWVIRRLPSDLAV